MRLVLGLDIRWSLGSCRVLFLIFWRLLALPKLPEIDARAIDCRANSSFQRIYVVLWLSLFWKYTKPIENSSYFLRQVRSPSSQPWVERVCSFLFLLLISIVSFSKVDWVIRIFDWVFLFPLIWTDLGFLRATVWDLDEWLYRFTVNCWFEFCFC